MLEVSDFAIDSFLWTRCKLPSFILYFGMHFSSALLVILSVEKFIALYFPLQTMAICTVRVARRVSLVTTVVVLIWCIQYFILGRVAKTESGLSCEYDNLDRNYFIILNSILLPILHSYGPFAIMGVTNCAIVYKFMMARLKTGRGGTESTSQALSKSATRGTAMLLSVSFAFIILTGPINIASGIWAEDMPDLILVIMLTFLNMNHGINGVLYCITGTRFRSELLKMIRCGKKNTNSMSEGLVTRTTSIPSSTAAGTDVNVAASGPFVLGTSRCP